MIVTSIVPFDKKRKKIFIDGEYAFLLYFGDIRDCGIKEGKELPEAEYHRILEEILPKRAKLRAMNLLKSRDYTRKQLGDKLAEGLYPGDVIEEALNYVEFYRYIDDERYARDYITYHMSSRSRKRIAQDLANKGISRDILGPVMEELYAEEDGDIEFEQVMELLRKKHYDPDTADFKEKQKLMAFLLRKGFDMSTVRKAMNCDFD
jgi:regulatory protein